MQNSGSINEMFLWSFVQAPYIGQWQTQVRSGRLQMLWFLLFADLRVTGFQMRMQAFVPAARPEQKEL